MDAKCKYRSPIHNSLTKLENLKTSCFHPRFIRKTPFPNFLSLNFPPKSLFPSNHKFFKTEIFSVPNRDYHAIPPSISNFTNQIVESFFKKCRESFIRPVSDHQCNRSRIDALWILYLAIFLEIRPPLRFNLIWISSPPSSIKFEITIDEGHDRVRSGAI